MRGLTSILQPQMQELPVFTVVRHKVYFPHSGWISFEHRVSLRFPTLHDMFYQMISHEKDWPSKLDKAILNECTFGCFIASAILNCAHVVGHVKLCGCRDFDVIQ